jgi:hypothetical protein
MVVSLDQTQQERVYKYFHKHFHPVWNGIKQPQMDETTRRQEINVSRGNLQQYLNQKDSRRLHLEDAMIDYLLLREHEEALHLHQTCVPDILRPHFQNISHPKLLAEVTRLVVFPAPAVLVNPPQPAHATAPETPSVAASQEAIYDVLIDSYDAVRAGRIKSPETIREIARRFLAIENDPEANKNFPYDAGEAARILLRRAKLYENHDSSGDIYKL